MLSFIKASIEKIMYDAETMGFKHEDEYQRTIENYKKQFTALDKDLSRKIGSDIGQISHMKASLYSKLTPANGPLKVKYIDESKLRGIPRTKLSNLHFKSVTRKASDDLLKGFQVLDAYATGMMTSYKILDKMYNKPKSFKNLYRHYTVTSGSQALSSQSKDDLKGILTKGLTEFYVVNIEIESVPELDKCIPIEYMYEELSSLKYLINRVMITLNKAVKVSGNAKALQESGLDPMTFKFNYLNRVMTIYMNMIYSSYAVIQYKNAYRIKYLKESISKN